MSINLFKGTYPVIEIFDSIQGEGLNIGTPATFIRFAGCNLNCPWCDTNWHNAKEILTVDQIVARINFKLPMIVFTGGEPFLQSMRPLLKEIRRIDKDILIAFETNGTQSTKDTDGILNIWITCSPKPETNWKISPACNYNELKYVIDDDIKLENIDTECAFVWLQPQGFDMQNSWKKCFKLAMEDPDHLRVGVQLHKLMEVR